MKKTEKKVADLTVEELKEIIDEIVDLRFDENMLQWFGDPDEGLELKPQVIRDLKRTMRRIREGKEKLIPMEEVLRNFAKKKRKE